MTIEEIIQRIQSLYSKGVQSDDSRLMDRHIYNKMVTVRSRLISQDAKRKQKISQWNYQTIPCVELEIAPPHECPCVPRGCQILKTKHPLPEVLTDYNNHLIESVTNLDGSIIYAETTWKKKKYKSGNKYTAAKPDYYIRNKYLYITHRTGPKVIAITALFEDPLDAEYYPSLCGNENFTDCTPAYEREFPIDNDKIDTLIEMCINELVIQFSQSREDLTNDTKDNEIQPSK